MGISSPVKTRSPTMYLDFKIEPNKVLSPFNLRYLVNLTQEFIQEIPDGWNAFVYTLQGKALFGNNATVGPAHHTLLLASTDGPLKVKTENEAVHFVLIAGEPTHEPVVQYGPFVMNTQEEIYNAIRDYQTSSNGFERAKGWESAAVRDRQYQPMCLGDMSSQYIQDKLINSLPHLDFSISENKAISGLPITAGHY